MRIKAWYLVAAFTVAGMCAAAAPAAVAPRNDRPVHTICLKQGGLFFGPNAVFDTDTSGFADAGYFCFFYSPAAASTVPDVPAADLYTAETLRTDPRVKHVEKLCAAAGGTFYLFDEDHLGKIFDAGWGCRFL